MDRLEINNPKVLNVLQAQEDLLSTAPHLEGYRDESA
jgi:hypothetical protein